ncbi:MAG: glycosyltransferase [Candidatus Woesearchaeota archaeon]
MASIKKKQPLVSIIIITKNEEKNLPHLLNDIKKQDYAPLEIILSDAKSTDKTRLIAKRNKCIIVEGGMPSVGRNSGAKKAKGEILLFLDADVRLPSAFLKQNIQEFKARNLGCAGCYVKPLGNNSIDKLFHYILNMYMCLVQRIYPHMPGFCIFATKKVHNAIKGFDPTIKLSEDSNYIMKAGRISSFRMLSSQKIHASVRRFHKEGYLKAGFKYILVQPYRLLFGEIRSDIFNYKFDHYNKNNKATENKTTESLK